MSNLVILVILIIAVAGVVTVVIAGDPKLKAKIMALNDACYDAIHPPIPKTTVTVKPEITVAPPSVTLAIDVLPIIPEDAWPKLKYMGTISSIAEARTNGEQHGLWEMFLDHAKLRHYRYNRMLFTLIDGVAYSVEGTEWYEEYLLKVDFGDEPNEYLEQALHKGDLDAALEYLNSIVEITRDMPGIHNHVKAQRARELYSDKHNEMLDKIRTMSDTELASLALKYVNDETGSEYVALIRDAVDYRTKDLRVTAERLVAINTLKEHSEKVAALRK